MNEKTTKTIDFQFYSVAFKTIAELAGRCLSETDKCDDILWSIQTMAEGFAEEFDSATGV